jgi:hypothetical protein
LKFKSPKFRFSDCVDKFLITIGVLSAIISASTYPFMHLLYGRMAGTFVDYKMLEVVNSTDETAAMANTLVSYSKRKFYLQ